MSIILPYYPLLTWSAGVFMKNEIVVCWNLGRTGKWKCVCSSGCRCHTCCCKRRRHSCFCRCSWVGVGTCWSRCHTCCYRSHTCYCMCHTCCCRCHTCFCRFHTCSSRCWWVGAGAGVYAPLCAGPRYLLHQRQGGQGMQERCLRARWGNIRENILEGKCL